MGIRSDTHIKLFPCGQQPFFQGQNGLCNCKKKEQQQQNVILLDMCFMCFYRWANQGLDFLTVACDPKMLTILSEAKYQVL